MNEFREVKRGDIFFCEFEFNVACEQGGARPVVVISNNAANKHSPVITVVPVTSKKKKDLPTHAHIVLKMQSTVSCEQIHSVAKERLLGFVRSCNPREMAEIDKCLKVQLNLE